MKSRRAPWTSPDPIVLGYVHGVGAAAGNSDHVEEERRAPVWGSEFTTKAASIQGGVRGTGGQPRCSGLWPSYYPRVWHTRLPGLKSSPSGDLGLQRRSRRARGRRTPRRARNCRPKARVKILKYVNAAEVRNFIAAVLAAAADAVLFAHHLPKLGVKSS